MNKAKVDFENDKIIFSTGKIIYANKGIIGIAEYKDEFDNDKIKPIISEGYDDGLNSDNSLTKTEKRELANWAIELWKRWAN